MTETATDRPVYQRSAFRIPGARPLTDADAAGLLGAELNVSIGGTVLGEGTVTNAKVVDDGANLWVTVESNGRSCCSCGHVYPQDQIGSGLRTVASLRESTGGELRGDQRRAQCQHRPDWTLVCADAYACENRRYTAGVPEHIQPDPEQ